MVRKRDEGEDSPFDDEGDFNWRRPEEGEAGAGEDFCGEDIDEMSISNFSKRYTSQNSTAMGHHAAVHFEQQSNSEEMATQQSQIMENVNLFNRPQYQNNSLSNNH